MQRIVKRIHERGDGGDTSPWCYMGQRQKQRANLDNFMEMDLERISDKGKGEG